MSDKSAQFAHMQHFHAWLAGLSPAELGEILSRREDVLWPLPREIETVAYRLTLPWSISQAVSDLKAPAFAVLEILAAGGGDIEPWSSPETVTAMASRTDEQGLGSVVKAGFAELMASGLAFPADGGYRLAPSVVNNLPEWFTVFPDQDSRTREELEEALSEFGDKEYGVVRTLQRSRGIGVSNHVGSDGDPRSPIQKLLRAGLLIYLRDNTVRLLNNLLPFPRLSIPLHAPAVPKADPAISSSCAASGLEFVRITRVFLEKLEHSPVAMLRSSTLGVRPQAALEKQLQVDTFTLGLVLGVCEAARLTRRGFLDPSPGDEFSEYLTLTVAGREWMALPLAEQWAALLQAWWDHFSWRSQLVGERDEEDKPLKFFDPATTSDSLVVLRKAVIAALGGSREDVLERLKHAHPMWAAKPDIYDLDYVLREAELIGATVGTNPSEITEALLAGAELQPITEQHSPPLAEYILAQADMTILVPGPLPYEYNERLRRFCDVESPGIAAVYRINEASVRRGLDSGMSADDILATLREKNTGELPQAVDFLIRDVGSTHGALRVGSVQSYLRINDPATLDLVLESAVAKEAYLERIAPTVAVSSLPMGAVIAELREAGFHPAGESPSGITLDIGTRKYLLPSFPEEEDDEAPDYVHVAEQILSPPGEAPRLNAFEARKRLLANVDKRVAVTWHSLKGEQRSEGVVLRVGENDVTLNVGGFFTTIPFSRISEIER